jgi:hypothetical protein
MAQNWRFMTLENYGLDLTNTTQYVQTHITAGKSQFATLTNVVQTPLEI